MLGGTHRHGSGVGIDLGHVSRFAVDSRCIDTEPLALSDGEPVDAFVLGQFGTGVGVDDLAGPDTDRGTQERSGVTGGDEADVMRIGLVGNGQAARSGLFPDLVLGCVAHREHRPRQLLRRQHGEHVRLVFVVVDRPTQPTAFEPCVMAGGNRVEAQGDGAFGQCRELDLLVAGQAGIGGLPGRVRRNELVDDVIFEAVGEIPDVEGDSENIRGPPGIRRVLPRAASSGSGPQCAGRSGQGQVYPDHVVSGGHRPCGSHRRVDTTTHCCEYSHQRSPAIAVAIPAARARETTSPMTAPTASMSSLVVEGASENRSELRARAVDTPIAVST